MGVIVISLGTPRSARENFWCTWEHLGVPGTSLGALTTSLRVQATSLGVLATSLGTRTTSLGAPAKSLGASGITVDQSGKKKFCGTAAGAPGNHSYYLSFNDC